jgi:predicted PurR-regulated permease PerM
MADRLHKLARQVEQGSMMANGETGFLTNQLPVPLPASTIRAAAVDRSESATTRRRMLLNIDTWARSARIVAVCTIIAALWWAQALLIPLVLSILLSYALEPLVVRLVRWRLPRPVVVPVLLVLLLALLSGAVYGLRGEAISFLDRVAAAGHRIAEAIQSRGGGTPEPVARVQQAARELETAVMGATRPAQNADGVTPVRIDEPAIKWSDWFWQGSHSTLEFAGQTFVVFFLGYYLLLSGDLYRRKLVRIMPTFSEKKITVEILAEIDRQIERFLWARVVVSVVVGVAIWISFRALGLDDAGVWGILSAGLFAIPIAGPTLVAIGAGLAAFVQFGSVEKAVALGGASVAIGLLEGYALTPWLMSRVGEMNAVAVFVSLLFWGWLWGGWGLLLAVPMTAALKAVCERVPELNALAALLSE